MPSTDLLNLVSNELLAPLNAIRAWTHVLRRTGGLSPAQANALDGVDRNVEMQARIIDDLLDSAKVLHGELEVRTRPVPLHALLERAIEMARPAATAKGLSFDVRHDPRPHVLEVDPHRLQRAIANVLLNAIKFSDAERPLVLWSYVGAAFVEIGVRNAAGGVYPELLPPAPGDKDEERDLYAVKKMGLGLTLAKQLVELQGGHIEVRAGRHGSVASLVIRMPAAATKRLAHGSPNTARRSDLLARLDGLHVMLVEDDPDALEFLTLVLRGAGAQVSAFALAGPAFAFFANTSSDQRPDVIVSDIAMPIEDGYSLVSRLRSWEERNHALPVPAIAVTAFSREEDCRRALSSGFDRHVPKPVDAGRLVDAIAQWS